MMRCASKNERLPLLAPALEVERATLADLSKASERCSGATLRRLPP